MHCGSGDHTTDAFPGFLKRFPFDFRRGKNASASARLIKARRAGTGPRQFAGFYSCSGGWQPTLWLNMVCLLIAFVMPLGGQLLLALAYSDLDTTPFWSVA